MKFVNGAKPPGRRLFAEVELVRTRRCAVTDLWVQHNIASYTLARSFDRPPIAKIDITADINSFKGSGNHAHHSQLERFQVSGTFEVRARQRTPKRSYNLLIEYRPILLVILTRSEEKHSRQRSIELRSRN